MAIVVDTTPIMINHKLYDVQDIVKNGDRGFILYVEEVTPKEENIDQELIK